MSIKHDYASPIELGRIFSRSEYLEFKAELKHRRLMQRLSNLGMGLLYTATMASFLTIVYKIGVAIST